MRSVANDKYACRVGRCATAATVPAGAATLTRPAAFGQAEATIFIACHRMSPTSARHVAGGPSCAQTVRARFVRRRSVLFGRRKNSFAPVNLSQHIMSFRHPFFPSGSFSESFHLEDMLNVSTEGQAEVFGEGELSFAREMPEFPHMESGESTPTTSYSTTPSPAITPKRSRASSYVRSFSKIVIPLTLPGSTSQSEDCATGKARKLTAIECESTLR